MNPADYPRCKTCKWWEPDGFPPSDNQPIEVNQCVSPHFIRTHQRQSRWYIDEAGKRMFRFSADEAFVTDEDDYRSHISTGPDFGCVHWEAKDAPAPQ